MRVGVECPRDFELMLLVTVLSFMLQSGEFCEI